MLSGEWCHISSFFRFYLGFIVCFVIWDCSFGWNAHWLIHCVAILFAEWRTSCGADVHLGQMHIDSFTVLSFSLQNEEQAVVQMFIWVKCTLTHSLCCHSLCRMKNKLWHKCSFGSNTHRPLIVLLFCLQNEEQAVAQMFIWVKHTSTINCFVILFAEWRTSCGTNVHLGQTHIDH